MDTLRLVFTSDRVEVVIRSIERHDLAMICFSLDRNPQSHECNRKKMEMFWFLQLRFWSPYGSDYNSIVRFSLDHKHFFDSDDVSDSLASENQPLFNLPYACNRHLLIIFTAKPCLYRILCKHILATWDCFSLSILFNFTLWELRCNLLQTSQFHTLKARLDGEFSWSDINMHETALSG